MTAPSAAGRESLFASFDEEWRTVPTDLSGWANRASQMKQTAEKLAAALVEISQYADDEWRSGDKPYQFGIIARRALKDAGLL